jgi:hypothetical protein
VSTSQYPTGVSFNPDGSLLAISFFGEFTYVYDTSDYSVNTTLTDDNFNNDVSFNSDGSLLAIASADNNAYIYDTTNFNLQQTLTEASNNLTSVDFSNSGLVAFGSKDTNTYVYDTSDYSVVASIAYSNQNILDVSFNSDGSLLAFGSEDDKAYIIDTSDYSIDTTLNFNDNVNSVDFSVLISSSPVNLKIDSVTDIDSDGAVFNATLESITDINSVSLGFRVKDTDANLVDIFTGNTKSVSNLSLPKPFTDGTNELNDNTTYNVEAVVVDEDNNKAYYSDTSISFTTKGALNLRADPPDNIKDTSADLNGAIESSALEQVQKVDVYYDILDPSDGSIIKQNMVETVDLTNVSFEYKLNDVVTGLQSGETYDVRFIAVKK